MKEREWLKLFDKYNYVIDEIRRTNHVVVRATRGGQRSRFVIPSSSSDVRTIRNIEAALKRGKQ